MTNTNTYEIEKYVVTYFGGAGRSKRPYKYRAIISLYNSAGQFGSLYFHCDPCTLPDSDQLSEQGTLGSHFPLEEMPRILDILRNEKPVYFHQYLDWPTMGLISTSEEPVGEGEIDFGAR